MSYDEERIREGRSFRIDGGEEEEEPLEPPEGGAMNDFRFDEDTDNDPDSRYH